MGTRDTFISSILEVEVLYKDFPKSLRIRVERWVEKLVNSGSNPAFTAHRNAYTKLLLSMVRQTRFSEPFHKMPSDGRLAPFPTHLRSKLRPVEPPVAYEGGAIDGFWADMRARVTGIDVNDPSMEGGGYAYGYVHNLPVASTAGEEAREDLERAHSNTLSCAPPKRATTPVRSSSGSSSQQQQQHHNQQHGRHPRVSQSPPPPPYRRARARHGAAISNANNSTLHHTPVRVTAERESSHHHHQQSFAHEHEQEQTQGSAWHQHPHHSTLHETRMHSHQGRTHGHGPGHDGAVRSSGSSSAGAVDQNQSYGSFSEHDMGGKQQHRELPEDVAALHSVIREQSMRISILEDTLTQERQQHRLDTQHLEYQYLTELSRLREVEAAVSKEKEERGRCELELLQWQDQHSRSLVLTRQNSYGSNTSAYGSTFADVGGVGTGYTHGNTGVGAGAGAGNVGPGTGVAIGPGDCVGGDFANVSLARQNSYGSAMSAADAANASLEQEGGGYGAAYHGRADSRGSERSNNNSYNNSHSQHSNLDYAREYNSVEFDRAYAGAGEGLGSAVDEDDATAAVGEGVAGIVSGRIGTVRGARAPELSGSPARASSNPRSAEEKHHLIHISSPPPRLPPGRADGRPASPILERERDLPPAMPFPSASMISQGWANDSRIGSRSGNGSSVRFKSPAANTYSSPGRPPQSHIHMLPRAIEPIPHFLRDSTDQEDTEFLNYLSGFQEQLNRPL